jgi:hypothetical protein
METNVYYGSGTGQLITWSKFIPGAKYHALKACRVTDEISGFFISQICLEIPGHSRASAACKPARNWESSVIATDLAAKRIVTFLTGFYAPRKVRISLCLRPWSHEFCKMLMMMYLLVRSGITVTWRSTFFGPGISWRVVSFTPQLLYPPRKVSPNTLWLGILMGPRVGLEKWKFFALPRLENRPLRRQRIILCQYYLIRETL